MHAPAVHHDGTVHDDVRDSRRIVVRILKRRRDESVTLVALA